MSSCFPFAKLFHRIGRHLPEFDLALMVEVHTVLLLGQHPVMNRGGVGDVPASSVVSHQDRLVILALARGRCLGQVLITRIGQNEDRHSGCAEVLAQVRDKLLEGLVVLVGQILPGAVRSPLLPLTTLGRVGVCVYAN